MQADSEGFKLEGVQKEKQQTKNTPKISRIETQEGQDPTDQEQAQSDSNPLEPVVPSSSTVREGSRSIFGVDFIPFMPTLGEEVPYFNTIFYNKEKKRIVKRTEKEGGHRG